MVAQSLRFFISGNDFLINNFVQNTDFDTDIVNKDKSNIIFDLINNILEIWHPQKEFTKYYDEDYELWYINFLHSYYNDLIKYGAIDFELYYNCFYESQCNIEIFSSNLLKDFSNYNISIPFTCVKYTKKDMKALCKSNGIIYED